VESSLFFGGSVVAAVVAGAIALFAPCCSSFMLPAYFASAFQNRRLLVAMTFLFGAGVATVILPIALGAAPDPTMEVTKPPFMFYVFYAFENFVGIPGILYSSIGLFGLLAVLPFIDRRPHCADCADARSPS
jgi:hypothetical protein